MWIHTIVDARHDGHVFTTVEKIADNPVESTIWRSCWTCDGAVYRWMSTRCHNFDSWDGHSPVTTHLTRLRSGACDECDGQHDLLYQDESAPPYCPSCLGDVNLDILTGGDGDIIDVG